MALGVVTDLKRSVREIPPWGWGIVGIGALYLVLHRAKSQGGTGVSSATGGPIVAAQSPLNISDPSGGMSAFIDSLNSGYVTQAESLNAALQTMQDQNSSILDELRSQQASNLAGQGSTPSPDLGSPPDYGSFPNNITPIIAPISGALQPTGPSSGDVPDYAAMIQAGVQARLAELGMSPSAPVSSPVQARSQWWLTPPSPTSVWTNPPWSGDPYGERGGQPGSAQYAANTAPPAPNPVFTPEQRSPLTTSLPPGGVKPRGYTSA